MAKVKYRIREFNPTANQTGTHSVYAEAVVDNIITNKELAQKIQARGVGRVSEIKSILEEAAAIILEETAENNRIQLETGDGGALVSIYPLASGSINDKEVQQNPDRYPGKTRAEASMLTADRIKWTLGATVGRKFSQQFALNKQAQRVDYNPSQETAEPEGTDNTQTGGDNGGTPGGTTPGGDLEG